MKIDFAICYRFTQIRRVDIQCLVECRVNLQKPKSVGTAFLGYEIKIVDDNILEIPRGEVGDIIVKGDNVVCVPTEDGLEQEKYVFNYVII